MAKEIIQTMQTMHRSVKHQRSVVKNLQNKSLWSKTVDDIVWKLVDIVHLLHFEISCAFLKNYGDQSPAPATNLSQTLGSTGLALHYANVILQINTLVLALPLAVSDKSRDALYKALTLSIKSKLRGSHHRDKVATLFSASLALKISQLYCFACSFDLDNGLLYTMTVAEARAEMDRILQWLVPVAEATTLYYKNRAFGEWTNVVETDDIDVEEPHWPRQEEHHFIAVSSTSQGHVVNKIETLYHADKQRTEGYIVDLIRGLQYVHSLLRTHWTSGVLVKENTGMSSFKASLDEATDYGHVWFRCPGKSGTQAALACLAQANRPGSQPNYPYDINVVERSRNLSCPW